MEGYAVLGYSTQIEQAFFVVRASFGMGNDVILEKNGKKK